MNRTTVHSVSGAGEVQVALATDATMAGVYPGWRPPAAWWRAGAIARVQPARLLPWLLTLAFVARFSVRLWAGEAAFLTSGYSLYLTFAGNLLNGTGLCLAPGQACALRLPVYPMFIAPWLAAGWVYPGLALAQAAVGAGLVWVAWRMGRDLFGERVGILAASFAAISPYAIVHDTGVQDTVLVNALVACATYLLWQTRRRGAAAVCLGAGVMLGLVALTTARLTLLVPAALVWVAVGGGPTVRIRARNALLVALPVVMLLGGWIARNWNAVGAPVLTTEAGESLWLANNPWAMAHFPDRSIDLSVSDSYDGMTAGERAQYDRVSDSEVVRDRLLRAWAIDYIVAHPGVTLANAARKVWVSVAAQLSPARGAILQWGYALIFIPVHLLAAMALWRYRADWRVHGLFGAVLASFVVTTAVFWAHTSHKSYLDVFLFVYAAAALAGPGRRPA